MKWTVKMNVKDYVRNWSNQNIHTEYLGVSVDVTVEDTNCIMILNGKDGIEKVFRLIWELLSLYDGYFYEPIAFDIDGNNKDIKDLINLELYNTDKKWYSNELIGRANRDLSTEIMEKYDRFRNRGMQDKKMLKSVVNAFFYLKSENYSKINVNHRLSLLLNIVDGFAINTFKDTNNVKSNYDRFFKKTVSVEILKKGISLLGIDSETYKWLLAEERHTFDHYIYSENSLSTFVYESENEIAEYSIWYFVYVIELIMRINILKKIGVILNQEVIDYALEAINDWIIFVNDLDIDCTTHKYQLDQSLKRMYPVEKAKDCAKKYNEF